MNKSNEILLVDDDPGLLRLMSMRLTAAGYSVETAEDGKSALQRLSNTPFRLMITDLRMDGMDGMELFREARERAPSMPVIILTAHGSIPDAVAATQQGVFAFLTKPVDKNELLTTVDQALMISGGRESGDTDEAQWRRDIITRNPKMIELLSQAHLVAVADVNVMILGESGTGKELMAKAIHQASKRSQAPFVAVNCGTLPEQLLESELFGHVKGAFTGASTNHRGLFQAADGGTLFLDEIGDMPFTLQVKLLRVLQERQVRPVGSTQTIPVDVRIISASHQNLEAAMRAGRFREDLYYRLNVVSLKLPPLRERSEDIPLLANHCLKQLAERNQTPLRSFAPDAIEALITSDWPGNIRQLFNVVEQTAALSTSPVIPLALVKRALNEESHELPSLTDARNQFERDYVIKLLQIAGGNVAQASRLAKRNRTDFYKILSRHGIKPQDYVEY